jgi:hypothetical protein
MAREAHINKGDDNNDIPSSATGKLAHESAREAGATTDQHGNGLDLPDPESTALTSTMMDTATEPQSQLLRASPPSVGRAEVSRLPTRVTTASTNQPQITTSNPPEAATTCATASSSIHKPPTTRMTVIDLLNQQECINPYLNYARTCTRNDIPAFLDGLDALIAYGEQHKREDGVNAITRMLTLINVGDFVTKLRQQRLHSNK